MNDQLKVQAVRQGISLVRFEILQGLGISLNDAPLFKAYKNDELKGLGEMGLGGDEMVRYYRSLSDKWNDGSFHGMDVYASVRKTYSEQEIETLVCSVWDLEGAIKNGLSKDEVWRAARDKVNLYEYAEAKEAGISYEDLRTATAEGWGIINYLKARSAGYSHDEVAEFLALNEQYGRFGLSDYVWLRKEARTQHLQVIEVMDATAGNRHLREYYLEYRRSGIGHNRALEIVKLGIYPQHYVRAIREASHEQVLDAAKAGVGLEEYAKLRASNCRIKHHEIIEYRHVSPRGSLEYGINSYLKLIDRGIEYEAILMLGQAGLSLYEIGTLLGNDHRLNARQAREIMESDLTVAAYAALRDSGMSHAQIVKAAMKSTPDVDISD